MRGLLFLLAALGPALSLAQERQGVYQPTGGEPQPWSINAHHALFWKGEPYRPVGLRIDGNASSIDAAASAGIKDVIVELPVSGETWKQTLEQLEQRKMRYLLAIDSLAPGATGWAVEPQSYRISGIVAPRPIDIPMPETKSVLAITALRRDSAIVKVDRVPVSNGRFVYTVKPPTDLEHVLLLYPETTSQATLDSWEVFDAHRDALLRSLKAEANRPGLRGIVNPLGAIMPQQGASRNFVPTSARFQSEFAAYLESRFRNVDALMRSWSMSVNTAESFADLAKLVPLWNGTRGIESFWVPGKNELIAVEAKRSSYWADLRLFLNSTEARRYQRLAQSIRKVADVPVLQEWTGWTPQVEVENAAIDGIGMRSSGSTLMQLAESGSRASSSLARWSRPGWLVATNIDGIPATEVAQLPNVLDDLQSMGAQGFFVRTSDAALRAGLATLVEPRIANMAAANSSPIPLFFPESALNPAAPQRLPGGRWWLPAPVSGNRIELGTQYFAYRLGTGPSTTTVLWSKNPLGRVKLRLATPKNAVFTTLDGSDPSPRLAKNHVEITMGSVPILITGTDEIPIPEPAMLELMARFDAFSKDAGSLRLQIGEEEFVYKDAMAGFDRNPGGSFSTAFEAVEALNRKLARYVWIEAESFRDSTFSEVTLMPGVSDGAVLNLKSMLPGLVNDAFAEYTAQNRSSGDVELWIAARIPAAFRDQVSVNVGGQVLRLSGEPVSLYGAGFGWYRLGVTRFGGPTIGLKLRVAADVGTDLSIDVIACMPPGFRPSGVARPDAVPFAIPVPKP